MLIERMIILLIVASMIIAIWGAIRLRQRLRLRALESHQPLGTIVPPGQPAIVAFSTPPCAECRTRQIPALTRLTGELGDTVVVRTLSALEHPDLVAQLGILTVPATVVVDRRGIVRHLNLGFTSDARLREQLQQV